MFWKTAPIESLEEVSNILDFSLYTRIYNQLNVKMNDGLLIYDYLLKHKGFKGISLVD
jgi:hypothetical protein